METITKLVSFSAALILSGTLVTLLGLSGQVSAQAQGMDVGKLKEILNETRAAIEANDDPGALTQLDMADQLLSGNTTSGNATGNEAIVTG